MSLLRCILAAEKPKDGKPFTICEVGTWLWLEIRLSTEEGDKIEDVANDLYNQFHTGKDQTERGATLSEILALYSKSNGGIKIIPKTKDNIVDALQWRDYIKNQK